MIKSIVFLLIMVRFVSGNAQELNGSIQTKLDQAELLIDNYTLDSAFVILKEIEVNIQSFKPNLLHINFNRNYGFYLKQKGKIDSAEIYYQKALALSLKNQDQIMAYKLYVDLSVLKRKQGDLGASINYGKSSLMLAEQMDSIRFKMIAYNSLSIAYRLRGEYNKAIKNAFNSLYLAQDMGNQSLVVHAKNSIGIIYEEIGNNGKALQYYQEVYSYATEQDNTELLSIALTNLSSVYNNIKDYKKAILFEKKSLKIEKDEGDFFGAALSYRGVGNSYFNLAQFDSADVYYLKSYNLVKKYSFKSLYADCLIDLGKMALQKKQSEKSDSLLTIVQNLLWNGETASNLRQSYYAIRKDLYIQTDQKELALAYYDSLLWIEDSLIRKDYSVLLNENENKIEINKLRIDREKIVQKMRTEKNNLIFLYSLLGFVFISGIIFLWIRFRNKKNKQLAWLNKKSLTISTEKIKSKAFLEKMVQNLSNPIKIEEFKADFLFHFEKAYPQFVQQLLKDYAQIKFSKTDLLLCKLLALHCKNYQCEWVLDLSKDACKSHKSRLKKKLNHSNLPNFNLENRLNEILL